MCQRRNHHFVHLDEYLLQKLANFTPQERISLPDLRHIVWYQNVRQSLLFLSALSSCFFTQTCSDNLVLKLGRFLPRTSIYGARHLTRHLRYANQQPNDFGPSRRYPKLPQCTIRLDDKTQTWRREN